MADRWETGAGPASARSLAPSSSPQQTGSMAAAAAAEVDAALRNEERNRALAFFRAILVLSLVTLAFMPFLPGPLWMRAVAAIGDVIGFLTCALGYVRLRRGRAYTNRLVTAAGVACSFAGVAVIFYVGIFSAAAMVLAIGVYFFASSQSRAAARLVYGAVAGQYLALSSCIAAGLIPDSSLFSSEGVAAFTRWFQVVMSQVIFGVTFYMARNNRRTLEGAFGRVIAASRQIRQRDAQLAEAHLEINRALGPGGGRRAGESLGPYVLGKLLGRGGMGEVYSAEHRGTGQRAAVKVLHEHLLENPQHKRLFLREAEVALSLRSPHIVKVHELGETQDGAPYIAMEQLDGHDLAWHLRKNGRLELPDVVALIEQIERALVVMRDAQLVHRDLKPGNLFLSEGSAPGWKILDFGLAKAIGTSSSLTRDQMLGTPAYMAPEQLLGEVSPVSDLYAVAAIAYRAITGAVPFEGDDVARVVFKVAYDQPTAPAEFVRVPSDVELVLAIGLAKAPADRFATIEALADALRAAATGDLDDVTRRRGWQLLRRAPWGSSRPPEISSRALNPPLTATG